MKRSIIAITHICLLTALIEAYNIKHEDMPWFCLHSSNHNYNSARSRISNCKEIGKGSFGVVQSCHMDNSKYIAKKILKIETHDETEYKRNVAAIYSEIYTMAQLNNTEENKTYQSYAGIAYVDSCFYSGNSIELIMDYFPLDLDKSIKEEKNSSQYLSLPHKIFLTMILVRAVYRLHKDGFLHLDIKPANILMRDTFTPVLADYTLSKEIPKDLFYYGNHELVSTLLNRRVNIKLSSHVGTPFYMTKETFIANNYAYEYGKETDIFALGGVIFNLWNGIVPAYKYEGTTMLDKKNAYDKFLENFCDSHKNIYDTNPLKSQIQFYIFCKAYGDLFKSIINSDMSKRPIGDNLIKGFEKASIRAADIYTEYYEKYIDIYQNRFNWHTWASTSLYLIFFTE